MEQQEQVSYNKAVSGSDNRIQMKATYNKMGIIMTVMTVIVIGLQFAYGKFLPLVFGTDIIEKDWFAFGQIILPFHLVAFSAVMLIGRKMECQSIVQHKMKLPQILGAALMCAAVVAAGSIIGSLVNMAVVLPFNGDPNTTALSELMMGSGFFWRVLTVGILAPIVEEVIFRKFLIDRTVKYGEFAAILASGLLFGIFHGNFSQFFYAFGLGMFFAFIYIRTGKVWYVIALHMLVNLTSSVITMFFLQQLDMEGIQRLSTMDATSQEAQELAMQLLPGELMCFGWLAVLCLFALVGVILFIIAFAKKKFSLQETQCQVTEKKASAIWGNVGMILYMVAGIALFVIYYYGIIHAA